MKKIVFCVLLLTLLLSFCTVFADQDGRNCWCNIDEYGCWITGEDSGKTYIMFWSEEARLYIMGSGSAPYKLVVKKPGETDFLTLKCGSPEPVVIPTAAPSAEPDEKPQEPAYDCDGFDVWACYDKCERINNCEEADEPMCWDIYFTCQSKCQDKDRNCTNQ